MSRIYWWNPITLAGGHGEPIPGYLAEAWLRHLKAEYPFLHQSVMSERGPEGPKGSHANP